MCTLMLISIFSVSAFISKVQAEIFAEKDLPKSYEDFVLLDKYPSLNKAISKEKFIIIPEGKYVIDNPIIINRNTPLYILGAARQRVVLVPKNLSKPLFIVKKAPFFKIAYLSIGPQTVTNRGNVATNKRHEHHAFVIQNTVPIHMEFHGLFLRESAIEVAGPGKFIFRGTRSKGMAVVPYCLKIDHPKAEVYIRGGIGMSRGTPVNNDYMEKNFVTWKKQGHLEITTAGGEQTGRGFIRIDSPSPKGADIISHLRSEGVKLSHAGQKTKYRKEGKSVLLYVPKTDKKVNVLIQWQQNPCENDQTSRNAYLC